MDTGSQRSTIYCCILPIQRRSAYSVSYTHLDVYKRQVFLSPLVLMIPNAATGPALIFVGFLMISGFKDIDFADFTESFGPFVMIMFTVFTGSIASGISAGILAFVLIKTATGKFREVHPIMYVMAIPLICYFIYG